MMACFRGSRVITDSAGNFDLVEAEIPEPCSAADEHSRDEFT
jgi:hypothetical protein